MLNTAAVKDLLHLPQTLGVKEKKKEKKITKTLIIDSLKDPRHKTGKVQTLKMTRCEDNHSSVAMRFFSTVQLCCNETLNKFVHIYYHSSVR